MRGVGGRELRQKWTDGFSATFHIGRKRGGASGQARARRALSGAWRIARAVSGTMWVTGQASRGQGLRAGHTARAPSHFPGTAHLGLSRQFLQRPQSLEVQPLQVPQRCVFCGRIRPSPCAHSPPWACRLALVGSFGLLGALLWPGEGWCAATRRRASRRSQKSSNSDSVIRIDAPFGVLAASFTMRPCRGAEEVGRTASFSSSPVISRVAFAEIPPQWPPNLTFEIRQRPLFITGPPLRPDPQSYSALSDYLLWFKEWL